MKYYVRVKKYDYYFYLYNKNRELIKSFLTFGSLVGYLEENNINFEDVKFYLNLHQLFKHVIEYESVKRLISYTKFQEEKKEIFYNE